tara:strand:+ start:147 stop:1421 length:1275 start_codon:yes stop_codon:yes gene_type:complete
MKNSKIVCIIIDAYSTGKKLPDLIQNYGYSCIHIKSSSALPSRFQHNKSDFIMNLTYTGNVDSILERLKPYTVKLCIPGYESGVELADLLSDKLSLPSNGSKYSLMRRNKHIMNEAVAKAGLRTVQNCLSDNISTLKSWARNLNHYPVVAKPYDSANGDGVFFCDNENQLQRAFENIINSENQFGSKNTNVLVEGLNVGEEYIINTVSWDGNHRVAEIWRVTRILHTTIYDKAEVLSGHEKEWQPLVDYTFKVLDALKIKYGAATTEVKYTQETGATLLETSARLMGNSPIEFSYKLAGFTQLSLLVEAYLNTEKFLEDTYNIRPNKDLKGMTVVLLSEHEGIINKRFGEYFNHLKTLHSYNIDDTPGSQLQKTTNSLTAPGELYLIGSKSDIEKDYHEIRQIEQDIYLKSTQTQSTTLSQEFS